MRQQASRRTGVASAAGVCRPHAVAALTSHQQLVSARQSNATASAHRRRDGGWCAQATCNSDSKPAPTSPRRLVCAGADFASAARECKAIECDSKRAAALTSHQQLVSARQSNATASEPPHRRRIGGWCVQATCSSRADLAPAACECEAIECDSKRAAALTSHRRLVCSGHMQ
jgi:hypothetical protein